MKITVCDLCKKNPPDAKIKYKYKAKNAFGGFGTKKNYTKNVVGQE